MRIESLIRQLAKKIETLNLFISAKELSGVSLFRNKSDLSKLQQLFLSYLYFYNEIYDDINQKKIDKIIFKDEIYEDSYNLWKRENPEDYSNKKDKKRNKKDKSKKDVYLVFDKDKKR